MDGARFRWTVLTVILLTTAALVTAINVAWALDTSRAGPGESATVASRRPMWAGTTRELLLEAKHLGSRNPRLRNFAHAGQVVRLADCTAVEVLDTARGGVTRVRILNSVSNGPVSVVWIIRDWLVPKNRSAKAAGIADGHDCC